MQQERTILYNDEYITVFFEASKAVHYPNFINGEYGHQDEPEEFIIESIEKDGVCVDLNDYDLEDIEYIIKKEDKEAYEAYLERDL